MRKPFVLFLFAFCFANVSARYRCLWEDDKRGRLTLGFHVGASCSSVGNITTMLESNDVRPDYEWEKMPRWSPAADLYLEYMRGRVGVTSKLGYYSQGLKLTKTLPRWEEKYRFAFHYATLGIYMKLYCYKGLYMGIGGRISYNLTPDGIDYSSNRYVNYAFYEKQQQEHLRETFEGRTEAAPGILIGHEFDFGLQVEALYHFGANDIIKTHDNKYGYTERRNNTNMIEIKIGYIITIFNYEKEKKSWERYRNAPRWHR